MASVRAAASLWNANGLPPEALSHLFLDPSSDSAVKSSFKLGEAAQTAIGLSGLAAAQFHQLRTGLEQNVTVDARHAVLEFKSESWYTVDGELASGQFFDELAGIYKTRDGYVRLHTNFPHHRQGTLDILQCAPTRQSVTDALLKWNAVDFETEAASNKVPASALRSFQQWDEHPQGRALANTPPVTLVKIADAPKREVQESASRPLEGIRILDLTRVLAGPICGRTLAAHGADVLLITSPKLPSLPLLDVETSRGKRTTQLDLTNYADHETLSSLVEGADVFLQAYRPGGLDDKGFGPITVAKSRPGIIYATLCAYGWKGPWSNRRGFDSLVQTSTGLNVAEGEAYAAYTDDPAVPKALPMQALDHAAGYLLAFGINAALCKTITEGGSWEVRVSLAAVGQWIRSLGRLEPEVGFGQGRPMPPRTLPQDPEIAALSVSLAQSLRDDDENTAPRKQMTAIRHAAVLSKTPVRAGDAPMVLDAHAPAWL